MKKHLWVLWRLLRSIGGRSVLLWLQVLVLSLAINFSLAIPISSLIGYQIYGDSGLEEVGFFTVGYQFIDWISRERSPAYEELLRELSQITEIGVVENTYGEIGNEWAEIIVYPQIFIDRIDLPIPHNSDALRGIDRSDALPLILDSRLRSDYKIGEEVIISINNCEYQSYVVDFLDAENEHFGAPYASSSPTLNNMLYSNEENFVILTRESSLLSPTIFSAAHSALYMFPPSGESLMDHLPKWQKILDEKWLGKVHSLSDMRTEEILDTLIGSMTELYLVCVWCFALFVVGLQGYFTYLSKRMHSQMIIYRMVGMRRITWLVHTVLIIPFPVILFALAGHYLSEFVMMEQINRVSEMLRYGTILFAGLSMLPTLLIDIVNWRTNLVGILQEEGKGAWEAL